MKNRGKRYSKAFKRECIDYVRKNQDIPMSEAADNLGVPNSTLQRWVKQADRRWKRKERRINFRWTIGVSTSQARGSEIEDGGRDSKKGHTYNIKDTSSRRFGGKTISFYPGGVCNVSNSNVVFGYELSRSGFYDWKKRPQKNQDRLLKKWTW